MQRYCQNCKKDFEFKIKSIKDLDTMVCPQCGQKIEANSKNTERIKKIEENESRIGNTLGAFYGMAYMFYGFFALIGIIAYCTNLYTILYITTAINVFAFFLQLITSSLIFRSGLIFLPLGAFIFYMIFGTFDSICFGIQLVFAVRHIIRDMFFRFIFWLISKIQK